MSDRPNNKRQRSAPADHPLLGHEPAPDPPQWLPPWPPLLVPELQPGLFGSDSGAGAGVSGAARVPSVPSAPSHQKTVSISSQLHRMSFAPEVPHDYAVSLLHFHHPYLHYPPQALSKHPQAPLLVFPPHGSSGGDYPPDSSALSPEDLRIANSAFNKLLPSLANVDAFNFGEFLVEVLSECDNPVPLDDFYNLLYNLKFFKAFLATSEARLDKSEPRMHFAAGLEICNRILDIFRDPEGALSVSLGSKIDLVMLATVNIHELLRSFLAIKIIMDILVEAKDTRASLDQATLPRFSIYKAYFVLCQKLISKYPSESNSTKIQQKLILGQSKFGKIIKLVYPGLVAKRLGRRGQSKYNYLGVSWNPALIDSDTEDLIQQDLEKITEVIKTRREDRKVHKRHTSITHQRRHLSKGFELLQQPKPADDDKAPLERVCTPASKYSYIHANSLYPSSDCSPHLWQIPGPDIYLHSEGTWAQSVMVKSANALKSQGVNIDCFLADFFKGLFQNDPDWLLNSILHMIEKLLQTSDETYLNVFMIVFLLVVPPTTGPSAEVPQAYKSHLLANLISVVENLETKAASLLMENTKLKTFVMILKGVKNINSMMRSVSRERINLDVVREIENDLNELISSRESEGEPVLLENYIRRALVIGIDAFSFQLDTDGRPATADELIKFIEKVASLYVSVAAELHHAIVNLERSTSAAAETQSRILDLFSRSLHRKCLSNEMVLQIPMPISNYIVERITSEIQRKSFHDFGTRSAALSRETFKTWWILCATFQEYNLITSEIVALSNHLAEAP